VSARLEGLTALVTGATRGIGAAIAERLASEGATVVVTGTGPSGSGPAGTDYYTVDLSDRAAADRFADVVAATIRPDILVNNAGINVVAPFSEVAPSDFDRVHDVNLRAPFLLCQAVLRPMRDRHWGRIVNVTSIFSVVSRAGRASYSASKFGLDGMTAAMAVEVAADGVLVNCVAPGFVDTDLTRRTLGDQGIAELIGKVPIGRLARTEEIAALVAWLASRENTYLTAQNIVIDGGFVRV
jgi:NAD(P)-dependent dehydrogenase (short-subunit alcohol dehydrogenase family)